MRRSADTLTSAAGRTSAFKTLNSLVAMGFFFACSFCAYRSLGFHLQYDDAYITYRFARNLATGLGLVFQPGEAANSASSPLWAAVLAVIWRSGFHDLEFAGGLLGLAAGGLTVATVALWRGGATWMERWAILPSLVLGGALAYWGVLGMETPLFALALVLSVRRLSRGRLNAAESLVLGFLPLIRYEGVVLLGALFLAGPRRFFKHAWTGWGITWLPVLVWGGFCRAHYGAWLPNSFELKTLHRYYARDFYDRWVVVRDYMKTMAPIWALALLTLVFWGGRPWRLSKTSSVLFWTLILAAVAVLNGPSADQCRYAVPFYPLAVLAGLRFVVLMRRRFHLKGRYYDFFLGILAVSLFQCALKDDLNLRTQAFRIGRIQVLRRDIGLFLNNKAPGSTVLSSDLGMIAWCAPACRFMDADALVSREAYVDLKAGRGLGPWILRERPTWLADTKDPGDARLVAEKIAEDPGATFRVPPGTPGFNLASHVNQSKGTVYCGSDGYCVEAFPILWDKGDSAPFRSGRLEGQRPTRRLLRTGINEIK